MGLRKRQEGLGIAKIFMWIFVAGIGAIISAYLYTLANKAYWDKQVTELCEKDGGVTVFKEVEVSPEEYEKYEGSYGAISTPSKRIAGSEYFPFMSKLEREAIKESNPHVYRWVGTIYRTSDDAILGVAVDYKRSGGDFAPLISRPSSFDCGDMGIRLDVENQVFIVPGEM